MPEVGGASTNAGALYQNAVTALWLARMLDESWGITVVRPETPFLRPVVDHSPERASVDDIRIDLGSRSIYCQVKISTSSGRWTWKELTEREDGKGDPRNVWQQFFWQFATSPDDDLQFWTTQGAEDLRELCDRASAYPDVKEFGASLSRELQVIFETLQPNLNPRATDVC